MYIYMVSESLRCAKMQYLYSVKDILGMEHTRRLGYIQPQVRILRLLVCYEENRRKDAVMEMKRPSPPFWKVISESVSQLMATGVGNTTTIRIRDLLKTC